MPDYIVIIVAHARGNTTREDVERAANWHADGLGLALQRVASEDLHASVTVKVVDPDE